MKLMILGLVLIFAGFIVSLFSFLCGLWVDIPAVFLIAAGLTVTVRGYEAADDED